MKISVVIIILLFIITGVVYPKNWEKSLKIKGKDVLKKVENEIKKEIKPLTIDFNVSKVGYNPLKSLNTLNLTIDFIGNNPNSLGVTFNRMEFDLFVNDNLVSKFYNEKQIKIPKNDTFTFQEKAEISLLEAGKAVFNEIRKKKAIYTIIGKYFVDSSFGTFSFDIKLLERELNEEVKSEKLINN